MAELCRARLQPAESYGHDQGDDHLLERPRDTGCNPRGRPGRRDFHRARTAARRSWQFVQKAGYRKCCPACSRRSLTSVSSATAFSTSGRNRFDRRIRPPRDRRGRAGSHSRRQQRRRCAIRRSSSRRPRLKRQPKGPSPANVPPLSVVPPRLIAAVATATRDKGPDPKIEELVKEGQEIIVQVAKEPLGTKGARLTPPPRCPAVGVHADRRSRRRIAQDRFARRTGRLGHCARVPRAARFHRRGHHPPAAAGRPKEDIVSDLFFSTGLDRHPPEIRVVTRASRRVPGAEPGGEAASRSAERGVSAIRIDNELEYRRVCELVDRIMPRFPPA